MKLKKSNCANTVSRFFHPSIERVEKLNFYDPNYIKESLFSSDELNSNKNFTPDEEQVMNNLSTFLKY